MSEKERITVTLDKEFYMDFCIRAYAAGTRPSKVIKSLMLSYVATRQAAEEAKHGVQASTSS